VSHTSSLMRSRQLIKVLTHPYFIGLIITTILTLTLMPEINKYKVDVIEKKNMPEGRSLFFSDLDNDLSSEKIRIQITPSRLNIVVFTGIGIIDQYNLTSKPLSEEFIYTEDYNNDGQKELFLLTRRNDSIMLSIIDPLTKKGFVVHERLVYSDTINHIDESPQSRFLGLINSVYTMEKDIVFSIVTGLSKQPRNFFRYNIKNDELKISPLSGVSFSNQLLTDQNGDSNPEIFFTTRATGNYESYIPYTDHSTWLMALNSDLEFLFEPREFPGYPASLQILPFINKDSNYIIALHDYNGVDTIQSALYVFDRSGRQLHSKPVEKVDINGYYLSLVEMKGEQLIYMFDATHSKVTMLNKAMEETGTFRIPQLSKGMLIDQFDIDQDGTNEKIFLGKNNGSIVIFREAFVHPLVVALKESAYASFSPYIVNGVPYLYVQSKNNGYVLKYDLNRLYYLKYPLLIGFYIAISFAILLVFRLQKYRAERDYQAKRKLGELQILTLKNQIDPHFTFNILNSIGSLYTRNSDPDLAYNVFVKYSNLLRFTIKNSDKISIPIEEELNFVNTYVELEQFRSGNTFEYKVDLEEGADLQTSIPRMLIHTFVENSIKHGVRMAGDDALLELKIFRKSKNHQILIRDNGPGLHSKTENRAHGTGKGIQIIDEMIALFSQLEGVRIKYTLENISLKDSNRQGTEALITIPS